MGGLFSTAEDTIVVKIRGRGKANDLAALTELMVNQYEKSLGFFDKASDDEKEKILEALKLDEDDLKRGSNCVISALSDLDKDELAELIGLIKPMNPNLIKFIEE